MNPYTLAHFGNYVCGGMLLLLFLALVIVRLQARTRTRDAAAGQSAPIYSPSGAADDTTSQWVDTGAGLLEDTGSEDQHAALGRKIRADLWTLDNFGG